MRSKAMPPPTGAASGVPEIAGVAGQYLEKRPLPQLQPNFQCIWTSVLPVQHSSDIAVLPDGCVDIIWRADRLLVVGPDITAARPDLPPGAHVIGARFQPGAARHWLGLPLSEIVGQSVELADLQGSWAKGFANRMEDAQSPERRAQAFQEQLMQAPRPPAGPDRGASEIFRLAAMSMRDEGRTVTCMRKRLDISPRTLLRHCRDHFGYGPKTLERILRFQHFLSLARQDHNVGLVMLAMDAGYADQAHLAREVRALCGMTATALLHQVRH